MFFMKIKSCFVMILILTFIFSIASFAMDNSKFSSTENVDINNFKISIAGGSVGGATGVIAEGAGEAIRKNNPNAVVTVKPGSAVENVILVDRGMEDFGLAWGPTAYLGLQGMEMYENKNENFSAVATLNIDAAQHFLIKKEVGLESLEQIKEEQFPLRVSLMRERNLGEVINRYVLEAYGVTYDDILSWGGRIIHQGSGETFEMMDDNKLDGFFTMLFFPAGGFIEANTRYPVTLLPVKDEVLDVVAEKLGMEKGVIPKDAYEFIDEDIPTLKGNQLLIVNNDIPDEVVYSVVKSLYDQINYLNTVSQSMKTLTVNVLPKVGKIPLHPGAEKFYRDAGLIE